MLKILVFIVKCQPSNSFWENLFNFLNKFWKIMLSDKDLSCVKLSSFCKIVPEAYSVLFRSYTCHYVNKVFDQKLKAFETWMYELGYTEICWIMCRWESRWLRWYPSFPNNCNFKIHLKITLTLSILTKYFSFCTPKSSKSSRAEIVLSVVCICIYVKQMYGWKCFCLNN